MTFVAQVDLAEAGGIPAYYGLPDNGVLSFFVSNTDGQVLYARTSTAELTLTDPPEDLPEEALFGETWLTGFTEITLPGSESPQVAALRLPPDGLRAYCRLLRDLNDNAELPFRAGAIHRLLGHPWPIQWDVAARAIKMASDLDWILLLQVRDERFAGLQWGSEGGVAYFLIPRADLAHHRFERVQLVIQSH